VYDREDAKARRKKNWNFKTYFSMLGTKQGICFQGLEAGSFPLRLRVFAVKKIRVGILPDRTTI